MNGMVVVAVCTTVRDPSFVPVGSIGLVTVHKSEIDFVCFILLLPVLCMFCTKLYTHKRREKRILFHFL